MKCYGEEKSLQAIAEASNAETLDTENVGDTADNLYFGVKQPTRVSFFLSRGNEVLGDYTMYMLYDTQENMRYSMTSTTAISFLAHHILLNETSGLRIGQAQAYPIFHLASPFEVKPGWLTMSGYISYCLTTN